MKRIIFALIVIIVSVYLAVVVWDYYRTQYRIHALPVSYGRIIDKYCPKEFSEREKRECCITSVESAAATGQRFVAPYALGNSIPSVVTCMTQTITIGPGCGEMFNWCDADEDRSRVITPVNFDILDYNSEEAETFREVMVALAERFGEPFETTAIMPRSWLEQKSVEGKVFFNSQKQYNGEFRARRNESGHWIIEMK